MSNPGQLRPVTIDGLKRLADRLQTTANMKRAQALDQAARQAGFQNFTHARRSIGAGPPARNVITESRLRVAIGRS